MPAFEKPGFPFSFDLGEEIARLRAHKTVREVPGKRADRMLLATWNVANLGAQDRRADDHRLIAEIVGWFDLVAIQEGRENLADLHAIRGFLPDGYELLFSDRAGNNERMAFVYDGRRVRLLDMVGEIAVPPASQRYVRLPGIEQKFRGFDRNPYVAGFRCGAFEFLLVNVHLYFGSDSTRDRNRRRLETYAVARWADLRRKSDYRYTNDVVVVGDFNLPKAIPGDDVYEALVRRGLHLPEHTSRVGSSIASDNHYDQIAFFPDLTGAEYSGRSGVYDFDTVIFPQLWDHRGRNDFNTYLRHYLSDHRPMWAEFLC